MTALRKTEAGIGFREWEAKAASQTHLFLRLYNKKKINFPDYFMFSIYEIKEFVHSTA